MYVFVAVEFIVHEQRAVRRVVSDIERLGKKATMYGELEQSALAADVGFYSNRTYNVTYQGGVLGVHSIDDNLIEIARQFFALLAALGNAQASLALLSLAQQFNLS